MAVDHLKALLTVLVEELTQIHEKIDLNIDDRFIHGLQELNSEIYRNEINLDQLKEETHKLIIKLKTIELTGVNRLIYEALVMIFTNSSQIERQQHLEELMNNFYINLNEKLHQVDMVSSILSLVAYKKKISEFVPLAKLVVLKKLYENTENIEKTSLKTAAKELYEYIACPNILREDCYQIVTKKLKTRDYKLLEYTVVSTGERKGQLGDYYKLKIVVEYNQQKQLLQFFAKFFPANSNQREIAMLIYKKEEFFYNRFIPTLKQLGLGSITNFAADIFFIRSNGSIVMEDLSISEYASVDLLVPFDYEVLTAVMKVLARLHSCSILFEEKLGKILGKTVSIGDYYQNYLEEIMYNSEIPVVESARDLIVDFYLDKYSNIVKEMTMEQFKKKVKCAFDNVFQDVRRSKKYRNVMNHGDLWGNNILLRTDPETKRRSCHLVDYQLIRYCPPAIDILFVMHTNTDKSTRDKYLPRLLDEYYSEMKNILEQHDVDIDEIYPYGTFIECVSDMKPTAICMSLLYNQLWLMPKDVMADIVGSAEKSKKYFDRDRLEIFEKFFDFAPRKRIEENIQELYEVLSRY